MAKSKTISEKKVVPVYSWYEIYYATCEKEIYKAVDRIQAVRYSLSQAKEKKTVCIRVKEVNT